MLLDANWVLESVAAGELLPREEFVLSVAAPPAPPPGAPPPAPPSAGKKRKYQRRGPTAPRQPIARAARSA